MKNFYIYNNSFKLLVKTELVALIIYTAKCKTINMFLIYLL